MGQLFYDEYNDTTVSVVVFWWAELRNMDERIQVNLLPDEVFFNIFNYLDVNELVNCEMVCRRWRAMVLSNWKNLYRKKVLISIQI